MKTFNYLIKIELLSANVNRIIIHTFNNIVYLHTDLFTTMILGA